MAKNLANVNVGSAPNDGSGDLLRDAFVKVNQNFTGIYQNGQFLANTYDSIGVPGYSWETDKNTGIFRPEDGVIATSLNGFEGLVMRANGYIGWKGAPLVTTKYITKVIETITGGSTVIDETGNVTITGPGGEGGPTTLDGIPVVSTLPSDGNFEGRIVFNKTDNQFYVYLNGVWKKLVDVLGTGTKGYTGIQVVNALPGAADSWEGRLVIYNDIIYIYKDGQWIEFFSTLTPNAPKGIEIWTGVALPTDNLFPGRTILWAEPNGDDNVYVYKDNQWVSLADFLTANAPGGIASGAVLPTSGTDGELFYNTANGGLYIWDNGAWKLFQDYLGVNTLGIQTVTTLPTSGNEGDLVVYQGKIYIFKDGSWKLLADVLTPDAPGMVEIWNGAVGTLPTTDNFEGRTILHKAENRLYIYVNGAWQSYNNYLTPNASADRGIEIVGSLPAVNDAGNFEGRIVFNNTDGVLYIFIDGAWKTMQNYLTPDAPSGIEIVSTFPTSPFVGQTVIKAGVAYVWDGTNWVTLNSYVTPNAPEGIRIVSTVVGLAGVNDDVVFNTADNKLYKYTNGNWSQVSITVNATATVADGSLTTAKFAKSITPVEIVASLPSTGNFEGRIVYNTATDTLHRYNGTAWTNSTPAVSITGGLTADQITSVSNAALQGTLTATQIGANAVTTGKIQAGAIVTASIAANAIVAGLIATDAITARHVAANAITANEIEANAITALKIAAGAITAGKIAAGAISATEIAANAITADKFAAGVITAGKLAANSITAADIAANAITASELAADSVIAGKVKAGAIGATEIAANAITADKVAANAITAVSIRAGSIGAAQIAANAISADNIAAGSIKAGKIAAGAISTAELGANAITADKIAAGAITAGKIAAGSISAEQLKAGAISANILSADAFTAINANISKLSVSTIGANSIVASMIAANAIAAGKIQAGVIGAAELKVGAVTTDAIGANAITAGKIQAGSIGATQIAANAITADKIGVGAITAVKIESGSITTDKLAANSITTAKIAPYSIDGKIIIDGTLELDALKSGQFTAPYGTFSLGLTSTLRQSDGTSYYFLGLFETISADRFGLGVSVAQAGVFGLIASARNRTGFPFVALASYDTSYLGNYALGVLVNTAQSIINGDPSFLTDARPENSNVGFVAGRTSIKLWTTARFTSKWRAGDFADYGGYNQTTGQGQTFSSFSTCERSATDSSVWFAGNFTLWDGLLGSTVLNQTLVGYKYNNSAFVGLNVDSRWNAGKQASYAQIAYASLGTGTESFAGAFVGFDRNGTATSSIRLGFGSYAFYIYAGRGGPFTGAHDAYVDPAETLEIGDIVVDVEIINKKSVNDIVTKVSRSNSIKQKQVVGVVSLISGVNASFIPTAVSEQRTVTQPMSNPQPSDSDTPGKPDSEVSNIETEFLPGMESIHRINSYISINALGEGLVNVCGENGDIEIGDFITTSSMPGKGMKQDDDILRNYTVAKSRERMTFSSPTEVKQIACTYLCG